MAQQKVMREEIQVLIHGAEKEHQRIEETIKQFSGSRLEIIKVKTHLFEAYSRYLLQKCLDYCGWEKVGSIFKKELKYTLKKVQVALVTMKSLLEHDYILTEEFDNCRTEMSRSAFEVASSELHYEGKIWETYRMLLLERLQEVSKGTPESDPTFIPDNFNSMEKQYRKYIFNVSHFITFTLATLLTFTTSMYINFLVIIIISCFFSQNVFTTIFLFRNKSRKERE